MLLQLLLQLLLPLPQLLQLRRDHREFANALVLLLHCGCVLPKKKLLFALKTSNIFFAVLHRHCHRRALGCRWTRLLPKRFFGTRRCHRRVLGRSWTRMLPKRFFVPALP